jgi:3D-(3,5/4)-trihydroxycyclohexane-1,2-dione acylhydrolase (decyclizing)
VVLVDNEGFAAIGELSRSKGTAALGTRYRYRCDGFLGDGAARRDGETVLTDLALNAHGLGAARHPRPQGQGASPSIGSSDNQPALIHVPTDRYESVPSYESWWEVPVTEISESGYVQNARNGHRREAARGRSLI